MSSSSDCSSVEVFHRARNKKSRSGCTTCKIRHLKCDETKPECLRCTKTGRVCDGYSSKVVVHHQSTGNPLTLLTLNTLRSSKTNRALEYFLENTLSSLMGFNYNSEFWSRTLLQYSEASPAVMHSILALSALHEKKYHTSSNTIALPTTKSSLPFLEQYNKSIRYLHTQKSSPESHQFTLSCCIIFICLENMTGNYETALLHLSNGLTVLEAWYQLPIQNPSEIKAREQISHVFRRLDMQATAFMNSRRPRFLEICNTSPLNKTPQEFNIPSCFSNLKEAQNMLESIEVHLFYILTVKSTTDFPAWSIENEYYNTRMKLLAGEEPLIIRWKQAFDALCSRDSHLFQKEELQLSLVLALHHQCSHLMLQSNLQEEQYGTEKNASFNPLFQRVNALSSSLIKSSYAAGGKKGFSADMGIIGPLYLSALTAESVSVRREAIELLRGVGLKEGFWHPETAAGIAERDLEVEILVGTRNAEGGSVPKLAEKHCVVFL